MSNTATLELDPFVLAKEMEFGDVHFKYDKKSGLKAIIAIHDTTLGPALGGCRFVSYASTQDALYDAMRLAQGMSYKAAIAGLKLGGGKSVIIRPEKIINRKELFAAFGSFVEELGGRYITAMDSGTTVDDMDAIATRTEHVGSTSQGARSTGDPSSYTAYGVYRAIEAAVKTKYNKDDLSGIHVAIQGAGNVGFHLAKLLFEADARLTYCDVNQSALDKVTQAFGGKVVSVDNIFDVECDVFSPCALGGAINENTVDRLCSPIVVGAANNQLSTPEMGLKLQQKEILYAPDYVTNAGGLIQVALPNADNIKDKISNIYTTLIEIFAQSASTGETTAATADAMANEIIRKAGTRNAS